MEIIIRTDEHGRPAAVDVSGPSGAGPVPEPPTAVSLQAAALGAHNAGPAPTRPGTSGASSGAAAPAITVSEPSTLTAGEAPAG